MALLTKSLGDVKKVFLKISQNSQENTCDRASFLIKLKAPESLKIYIEFLEIAFKKLENEFFSLRLLTFFYLNFRNDNFSEFLQIAVSEIRDIYRTLSNFFTEFFCKNS